MKYFSDLFSIPEMTLYSDMSQVSSLVSVFLLSFTKFCVAIN